jgi:peptidoglycan/LPS O-acetylase OafA/YrhL
MTSITERVAAASVGRDRVLDAVKALALVVVVIGHSLAWHVTPRGSAVNVLEEAPSLILLTWVFQVLPLFFAAGAVSNASSLSRASSAEYLRHRSRRLLTPVLVYCTVWTLVLLPLTLVSEQAQAAGQFLSQLLWFAGVYLVVAAAAPVTTRWRRRSLLTLSVWLAVILAVDVARTLGAPQAIGWLNLVLVWGWLHQLGYELPRLRRFSRWATGLAAVALLAAAVFIAVTGPYSSSLVSVAGDPELSNLSPPSVVLALYGAAQVMALAALWPGLSRVLANARVWTGVALVGARGMGMYLWHIPLVGVAAAIALATGWSVPALSPAWWVVHILVVALVLPAAWLLAGVAEHAQRRLDRLPPLLGLPPALIAVGGALVVLNISVTGFATWLGDGMLGLPSMAVINLVLLAALWQGTGSRAISQVHARSSG